jgi:hypothetical protein
MLLEVWGLKNKLGSLDNLGTVPNIHALLDNRTEVGFLFLSCSPALAVVTPLRRNLAASGRKFYYVQVPKMAKLHVWGKIVVPEVVAANAKTAPDKYHPGALRYYKEIGAA